MTRISFLFVEMDFPGGRVSRGKIVEFPGGGGEYGQTLWNGKSRGVGGQTGKTLRGGVWIFSGTTHYSLSISMHSCPHQLSRDRNLVVHGPSPL